jgi:hypothetical protein
MIGEMAADWVLGKFKDLFSSIGKAATETMSSAASTAASAVGGITQGASQAIGGLWTGLGAAVGSFLGTALAGLIGGGPSGHAQQQQINDTKDIRNKAFDIHNWLMSYGLNIEKHIVEIRNERFDTIYTKFDGLKGSVDLTRSTLAGLLQEISKKLSSTPSAQHGAIVTATGLVRVHGTPTRPEFIIPAPNLQRMAANLRPASREGRTSVINITNEVHIDGQVVTTREYAREQLLPEIVQALKAGIRKSDLQAALGLS